MGKSLPLKSLIASLSDQVKQGQHGKVRRALLALNLARVSREERLALADLARRVNVPRFILQVLRPIVKAEPPVFPPPSVRERALYATGLSRLGVYGEAQDILDSMAKQDDAEVVLFRAYNLMFQWDFAAAIPLLRAYVARKDIEEYARLVGWINLASCLSSQHDFLGCEKVLNQVFKDLKADNVLLQANAVEIAAQVAVKQGHYPKARAWIEKAEGSLGGSESRYEMFVKKWKVILDLLESPFDQTALKNIKALKREAAKAGNWEVLRDLDFYQAKATRDDDLFLKVYFGSPYASYRTRIRSLYEPAFPIPKSFHYRFEVSGGEDSHRVFMLQKGCEDGGSAALSQFPLLLQLFQILISDFYRPVALGTIASKLYPDEYFNPQSSPLKVSQGITRLRKWFRDNGVPLSVIGKAGSLKLIATKPYGILVGAAEVAGAKNETLLEILRETFSTRIFTAQQAAEKLNVSKATVQALLKWAKRRRAIEQRAAGRSARYRLRE